MDSSYNNLGGFGSGGTVSPTSASVSSGTGDIVLTPEKKSRKGFIVAVIATLLIIGGLFAVMFLIPKNGDNVNLSESAKLAFNKYANYLLYGESSDKALEGKYSNNRGEKLFVMLEAASKQAESYAGNLNTLWNGFMSETGNFSFNDGVMRDDYDERVKFIATYLVNKSKVDEEAVMELTRNNAKEFLDSYFGLYQQFDFEEAKVYVENGRLYFENVVEIANAIRDLGCDIEGESVEGNAECSEESIFGDGGKYENLNADYSNMSMAVYDVADYLVENGWKIDAKLIGVSE